MDVFFFFERMRKKKKKTALDKDEKLKSMVEKFEVAEKFVK